MLNSCLELDGSRRRREKREERNFSYFEAAGLAFELIIKRYLLLFFFISFI
jgi:hypothetical protein